LNPIQAFYQAELRPGQAEIIHRAPGRYQRSFGSARNSIFPVGSRVGCKLSSDLGNLPTASSLNLTFTDTLPFRCEVEVKVQV
jgi:hypothetical protein